MADDEQYELKTVQVVRGAEARSVSKWQRSGWELVDEQRGKLRTTLTFRRRKPKPPWRLFAAVAAVLAIVGVIAAVVETLQSKDPTSATASGDRSSEEPSESNLEGSTSSGATSEASITAANSQEFAQLLRIPDNCDERVRRFAQEHRGESIEFDGSVAVRSKSAPTRYDMLLAPGDQGARATRGPAFKFEGVTLQELNLVGADPRPALVRPGARFRFTTEVKSFNGDQCLLFLDPIATQPR